MDSQQKSFNVEALEQEGEQNQCASDRNRATIAVVAACTVLLWQTAYSQVVIIALAGLIGWWLYSGNATAPAAPVSVPVSRSMGVAFLAVYFGLLIALPLLRSATGNLWIAVFDSFCRPGSLVFGGGHVVLPLLEREVVPAGWITTAASRMSPEATAA